MTDDEINVAVCRDVLGWAPHHGGDGLPCAWDGDEGMHYAGTPDFCNDWTAFGLLHTAMVAVNQDVEITSWMTPGGAMTWVEVIGAVRTKATDPRPGRALALAAIEAYTQTKEEVR